MYKKSEISEVRTVAWFLKPFRESVDENNYPGSSKTRFSKKLEQYRGCNICHQVFLENGKIDLKGKILNFNRN